MLNKIIPKIIIGLLVVAVINEWQLSRLAAKTSNFNAIAFSKARVAEANQEVLTQQEAEKAALKAFTIKVMDFKPSARLSNAKKELLANKIVNIVYNNVKGEEAQQTYITMLKEENNFVSNRKSSVGAIGLAQIMPTTFKSNAKDCGIDPIPEDLNDDDINLNFGSCYFQLLLNENENNARLANLAYSGGSKVVEHYKKTGDINKESAVYAFNVVYIKDKINGK